MAEGGEMRAESGGKGKADRVIGRWADRAQDW